MEDGDAEDDDVKGEEASMLMLRKRKRMILRRKTGTPLCASFGGRNAY